MILGQGAVQAVTQTINDLYFVVTVRGIAIPVASLAKGALAGVFATVAAAALPAWEATTVSPRQALTRSGLEETARRLVPLTALAGAIGIVVGGALLAVPTRSASASLGQGLAVSFAGIFSLTIGFALLAPAFTLIFSRLVAAPAQAVFGVLGRMAPRSVTGALSRTAVAVAALMVAVSVTIGVGLMVGSFRTTVVSWLGQTLWGDLYVSAPSLTATRSAAPLDPQVIDVVSRWPGAQRWDLLRSVDVASPVGPVAVSAVSDEDFTAPRIFIATDGGRAAAANAVKNGAVLASEPLANRLGLPAHGATVTLYTDRGPQVFPVAGIYRDYSNSQGTVMMALDLYRRYWDDASVTAALMVLKPGEDPDANVRGLQRRVGGHSGRDGAAQPGVARRGAGRIRPRVRHHRRAATVGRDRGVYRHPQRAAVAATGARPRVRPDARRGPDRPPAPRAGAAGNRADGVGRGTPGNPYRPRAGLGLDLHHQPPLVRLDDDAPG